MKKYIIPTTITFILAIYITSMITLELVENKYKYELIECKGINKVHEDEYNELLEKNGKTEKENMQLRFELDSCTSWCDDG